MPLSPAEITRRREALGLTMQQAAERAAKILLHLGAGKIKFDRMRWNKIESGAVNNPKYFTLEAIAGALECGIDDLRTSS